jgi:membrane protein involved in colicin uptake
MSKFKELAGLIRDDLKDFDAQATELMAKREKVRARAGAVFAKHHEAQDEVLAGLTAMDDALRDLEGGNGAPKDEEGSTDTSKASFQSGGERG